jgi:excisionase family DNA binding protein
MGNNVRLDVSEKDFLSVKEFASYIGVHYNTIIRSIKSGRLSAFRIGFGKRACYRIPKAEIHRIALMDLQEMILKIIEEKK